MTFSDPQDDMSSYGRSAHAAKPCDRRSIPPPSVTEFHGIQEVPRTPRDEAGPRQFIPYLYLFSPPQGTGAVPSGPWTHTLRLLPPSKTRPAGSTGLTGGGAGARGLDLHLPTAGFKPGQRDLYLCEDHLLLARDFLALALPYYASAHPSACSVSPFDARWPTSGAWASPGTAAPISHAPLEGMGYALPPVLPVTQADPVRVLVVGPPRAVLAIGLTYLAYASGCGVTQVMRGVLEGDGDAEWCQLLGEDGEMGLGRKDMQMLERVAMKEL
jgi:hypothetical protein